MKDCHACRDEEEPMLELGGWLKASPWKSNLLDEDTRGKEGRMRDVLERYLSQSQNL